jgi:hypothetical protein
MRYEPILSKQEPAQFHQAVEDGKEGQGPRIFVRLPYTRHGIVEVQEVAGRGMLSIKVAGDPLWHFVQPTQFLYESSEEERYAL